MRKTQHNPSPPRRRPDRRKNAGFTLIEVMVVIAIILVLLGASVTLGPSLLEGQRRSATRMTLLNARAIVAEYEVQTSTVPNHLAERTTPIDWTRNKTPNTGDNIGDENSGSDALDGTNEEDLKDHSIERFVWATLQVPAIKEMYTEFDSSTLTDEDEDSNTGKGFLELRDAWGNKLAYAKSVTHDDSAGDPSDADDFLPEREGEPFFASPGPDGQWGDVRELEKRQAGQSHDAQDAEWASDNLYSFEGEG